MTKTLKFRVMGKPRMTQRDKWAKRPCVVAYHSWCDMLRYLVFGKNIKKEAPETLRWVAYIKMPDSWSAKKKDQMKNKAHTQKPDLSNINKGIEDSLFLHDEQIAFGSQAKWWGREDQLIISIE
jgi:Holliday junction resolvase RusA-like endonuclease